MVELSKAVAVVLRHQPWVYELELDPEGWAPVDQLLEALRHSSPRWRELRRTDLEDMIARSVKRRYEISGPDIRALYGHSVPGRIEKVRATPPPVLFHGTAAAAAERIIVEGLRPMGRQYVHLSTDVEMAGQVGRRKDREPVILQVAADVADAAGTVFYRGNERVWLADEVPAGFITTAPVD